MTKTIRFYATATFANEIRVFPVEGPSPCTYHYDQIVATFPKTRKGWNDAMALTGTLNDAA